MKPLTEDEKAIKAVYQLTDTKKTDKVKFYHLIIGMNIQIKQCPRCGMIIEPKMIHAYNHEWCPSCGLNMD